MDITEIFERLKTQNPEGIEVAVGGISYIWLTNGLGHYYFDIPNNNEEEHVLCIIKEFDGKFYLEKSLISGKVVTYGNKGKVIESIEGQKFVFKSLEDGEFLDILTNPTIIIDESSSIGIIEFDRLGKPKEQDISSYNFNIMKEISDDIVSYFIRVSDGYEFGLSKQIDYFASALASLSLSQRNLLIPRISSSDDFKIISSYRKRLMEEFQLDNPDIISSFGKDFAVAVIIHDKHTSLSIINIREGIPGVLNIDLSKLHEKLFVNAKRYTNYLNKEQLQITACCSIIMLSCIEELSKILDLNALLEQVRDKSLLKDIIVNSSRKFEALENKAPLFPLRVLSYPEKNLYEKYPNQEMFEAIFSLSDEELYGNFSGNCIDFEALFKEFNFKLDQTLIDSQELWLADVFVKRMEKCTSCIEETIERIKNSLCSDEQKIILLSKIEYLKKASNKSAENIMNLNIDYKKFSDTKLSALRESILDRIMISCENLNTVYDSIKAERQRLESEPSFETYKNLFGSLFKSEIEGNDILIKKERTTYRQIETVSALEQLAKKLIKEESIKIYRLH